MASKLSSIAAAVDRRLSRRGLFVGTAAAATVAATTPLLDPSAQAAPATETTGQAMPAILTAALAEQVTAYHGVTGAVHQQQFNQLGAAGYRMIALSVYGDRADPRYAAVWIKRAGPAWAAVHGVDSPGYQARFDHYVALGYVPVLVSATGPGGNPVFAAVFEKMAAATWTARHGLVDGPEATPGTLANVTAWARTNNCVARSLTIYGGAGGRAYAGVWLPNTGVTKWQAHAMGDASAYQGWFDAYTAVPMRPALVDASDALQYAAIFTDDSVGPWTARHGLDAQQYQAEFNTQAALGRYPISVQGGGVGAGTRYAAVFAGRDLPVPRSWTQTDVVGAGYAGIHGVMRAFMQGRGVRAGQLAVRKNGVLRLSAGYTWAEPGYAVTQPNSLMRVASVSKAFTCAAIRRLSEAGSLNLDAPVFPLLDITSVALPGQTRDARIDSVTVRQCVQHTGGWVRGVSGVDPVFRTREFARALSLPGRATKRDVARYMYGEPLQYNPGDDTTYDGTARYSNFGYVLLGLVVEQVTGLPFITYLTQSVLAPLGIGGQVLVGATLRSGRQPGEAGYEDSNVGKSAWNPWSESYVPAAYGNFLVEAMDTGGGLITTAPAVTALINDNAVWGLGGRAPGSARSGSMPGTSSFAASRGGGIDWCYIINTNEVYDSEATLDKLAADLNSAVDSTAW
jgi:CubicO group peptidase (beta-lactamase class C family)